MRRLLWLLALVAVGSGLTATPAGAATPRSFFGVIGDGPLLSGAVRLAPEMQKMHATGIGSARIALYWWQVQPSAAAFDVAAFDRVVAAAAAAGVDVLPVVQGTPAWAAERPGDTASPPRNPATLAALMTRLVHRYGPGGTFWAAHRGLPARPIRRWQVWNEPDIDRYFDPAGAWAPAYVRLLAPSYRAIKAADPHAAVVLAGLTNRSWEDLGRVYAAGGRRWFDIAAIHPFSVKVGNVVKIVGLARQVMASHGDARKPLALTEVSWSSGAGRSTQNYGWETTERGQADRVHDVLVRLAARRTEYRLAGLWWYSWLSPAPGRPGSFDYSGLRRMSGARAVDKPALAAYRSTARALSR